MNILSKNNQKKIIVVGLTGGIGSGKSTVAKIFISLKVPVFNADLVSKSIVNNNKEVKQKIISIFGDVYNKNGLDNKKLATLVFNDTLKLEQLNKIIHPKVNKAFKDWLLLHKNAKIVIKEAAILIETGAYKKMDYTILVTSPKDLRIKRVIKRDQTNLESVLSRINNQMEDEEKIKFSDYVIVNDNRHLIIPQVLEIYKQIIS